MNGNGNNKLRGKRTFAAKMKLLQEAVQGRDSITLFEVTTIFGSVTHYFLSLLFSLPFLQPIAIPGLSAFLGIIIMMSGFCIVCDKRAWIPKFLRKKVLSHEFIDKGAQFWCKVNEKISPYLKPRGKFLIHESLFRIINGLLIICNALLLSLPLPIPGTNLLPGYAIFILSLAAIEQDGLFVVVGYFLSLCAALFFFLILVRPFLH